MAKSGNRKKKKRASQKAIGAGVLGAAATLVASKAVGEIVKEAVRGGTRKLRRMRGGASLDRDCGLHLLRLLDARGSQSVAHLVGALDRDLLDVLDIIRTLRRARLVKWTEGRRLLALTPLGLETINVLVPTLDAEGEADDAEMGEQASPDSEPAEDHADPVAGVDTRR